MGLLRILNKHLGKVAAVAMAASSAAHTLCLSIFILPFRVRARLNGPRPLR